MIKLNAAARLMVVAKADEAMARDYFKSFGIKVDKMSYSGTNSIDFYLSSKQAARAKKVLTKRVGKPVVESKPGSDPESMYFPLDDKQDRSIYLEVRKGNVRPSLIGLTDNSAK